ncbi:MAG: hypothetical protein ACOVNY_05405 [Chitinophagaceae bacterium]
MQETSIAILPSSQIIFSKWDECVAQASHENIFMYSWCLNNLCDNWCGVVIGNYDAVFPLPFRKKWGLKYMYQVPFIAKLSLMQQINFTINKEAIFKLLQQQFLFMHFDIDNFLFEKWKPKNRCNYFIRLNKTYDELSAQFTDSCKKNIRKAINRKCTLVNSNDYEVVFTLYEQAYGSLHKLHVSSNDYSLAKAFVKNAIALQKASVWHVLHETTAELLFGAIILEDKNRFYYWLGAPTTVGRQCRATYFFIDAFIQLYCCKPNAVFDFEGSDIENVAYFYQQFAPEKETYFEVNQTNFLSYFFQ